MNKLLKEKIKSIPFYKKIPRKNRYTNPIKDKAWAILSDYVRMRDWLRWGTCISSGRVITNWRESDAGHYESMSGHGALVGFSDLNIHMQSKNENQLSGMATGARYRDELIRRYGTGILEVIETQKQATIKADDWFFIERIEDIYELITSLKEDYPDADYPEYMNL